MPAAAKTSAKMYMCQKAEVSFCSLLNYACRDACVLIQPLAWTKQWLYPDRIIFWYIIIRQNNKVYWLHYCTGLFALIDGNKYASLRHLSWRALQYLWGHSCPSSWQPTLWFTYSSSCPSLLSLSPHFCRSPIHQPAWVKSRSGCWVKW